MKLLRSNKAPLERLVVAVSGCPEPLVVYTDGFDSPEAAKLNIMNRISLTHNSEIEEWVIGRTWYRHGPMTIHIRLSKITALWVEQDY